MKPGALRHLYWPLLPLLAVLGALAWAVICWPFSDRSLGLTVMSLSIMGIVFAAAAVGWHAVQFLTAVPQ